MVGKKTTQSLRRIPLPAAVLPYLPKIRARCRPISATVTGRAQALCSALCLLMAKADMIAGHIDSAAQGHCATLLPARDTVLLAALRSSLMWKVAFPR